MRLTNKTGLFAVLLLCALLLAGCLGRGSERSPGPKAKTPEELLEEQKRDESSQQAAESAWMTLDSRRKLLLQEIVAAMQSAESNRNKVGEETQKADRLEGQNIEIDSTIAYLQRVTGDRDNARKAYGSYFEAHREQISDTGSAEHAESERLYLVYLENEKIARNIDADAQLARWQKQKQQNLKDIEASRKKAKECGSEMEKCNSYVMHVKLGLLSLDTPAETVTCGMHLIGYHSSDSCYALEQDANLYFKESDDDTKGGEGDFSKAGEYVKTPDEDPLDDRESAAVFELMRDRIYLRKPGSEPEATDLRYEDENIVNMWLFAAANGYVSAQKYTAAANQLNAIQNIKTVDPDVAILIALLLPVEYTGLTGETKSLPVMSYYRGDTSGLGSLSRPSLYVIGSHDLIDILGTIDAVKAKPNTMNYPDTLCKNHFLSYHTFTGELVSHVGAQNYARFCSARPDSENRNILEFVKYFNITRETFEKLNQQAAKGGSFLPYNIDMVYHENQSAARLYFTLKV